MVFGNEIVVDIIRKEGVIVEQGGPLALYDWCPYETGKCGHRSRHTRRKDNMKTLGEEAAAWVPRKARGPQELERGLEQRLPWNLRGSTACSHPDLGLSASKTETTNFYCPELPFSGHFVTAATGD